LLETDGEWNKYNIKKGVIVWFSHP
jgi:hypothetical protein